MSNTATPAPGQVPAQEFKTAGIEAMQRPGLKVRLFMAIVAWVERMNVRFSAVGNPPVYDNATFPWAAEVERDWPAIRRELDAILARKEELPNFQDISTDVKTITTDNQWKTFFLVGYGVECRPNIERCPETWRALRKIPGLKTAMFSILSPGKHIPRHRGPYNGVLRLHPGLLVPEPREKIRIRVDRQFCHWSEGKALIFDDAYDHEVWNDSPGTRVVLFVDFVKPLRFPARLLNWLVLNLAPFTPFIREASDNHQAWEQKYYAQIEAYRNRDNRGPS